MTGQLDIFGNAVAGQTGLGPVQLAVLEFLKEHDTISAAEAGQIAHSLRGKHAADESCVYDGPDGAPVLLSLLRRGLVERGADGAVRLPRPKASHPTDDIPY